MEALESLLDWYQPRRNAYPWRLPSVDAYGVLVSEFMLQQTQASRVARAFEPFMVRFPSVTALAEAPTAEVIRAWSGLGYNRRAVALSRVARAIVSDHRAHVPSDPARLEQLPGVGPYTAAAVASISFDVPVPAIDTNVRRVLSRSLFGVDPFDVPASDLRAAAEDAIDRETPGAWNQALMDVGREHCRPLPRCGGCPLRSGCRFEMAGPAKQRVAPRPQASFEGSTRQVRGDVVRTLAVGASTVTRLAAATGHSRRRIEDAIEALTRDGVIAAGGTDGRLRLAEDVSPSRTRASRRSGRPEPG